MKRNNKAIRITAVFTVFLGIGFIALNALVTSNNSNIDFNKINSSLPMIMQ